MQKRILIVEDDPGLRGTMSVLLIEQDYEIETATTVSDIKQLIKTFKPNLLLLDTSIGLLNLKWICQNIRLEVIQELLPIILLTAAPVTKEILYYTNTVCVIQKPIDVTLFIGQINLSIYSDLRESAY